MRFGSYECWIAYEDRPLDEYSIQVQEGARELGPALSKAYVMSELGKSFHLNWRDHTVRDTLLVTVRMDGRLVSRGIHAPGTSGRLQGLPTGPRTMKLFTFSSPDPSRRFNTVSSPEDYADFGTIQVTMVPIRSIKSASVLGPGPVAHDLPTMSSMHYVSMLQECILSDRILKESSKKALSLMPSPDIDIMAHQTVVFEFRYRPLVHLQALGIFPFPSPLLANFPTGSVSGNSPPDSLSSTEDRSPHDCHILGKRSRREYEETSVEDDGE